jgi:predicted histidine transporter YuiF (NhaC family)
MFGMFGKLYRKALAEYMKKQDPGTSVEEIPKYVILIGMTSIVIGLMVKILNGMKSGETSSQVNNTLDAGINAVDSFSEWLDDIVTVVIAVVILGLVYLVYAFYSSYRDSI